MSELLVCHVGGEPVDGRPFVVKIGDETKVPMCDLHGRCWQFGNAVVGRLGADHPMLVELAEIVGRRCSEAAGVIPLPGTGAEGQNNPLLRRGLATRCAGVPDGMAVSL
jgi:hypothetical protein